VAQYKYREALMQTSNAAFDTRHAPGTSVQNTGLYRCTGCGDEMVFSKGQKLPALSQHQHEPGQRKVEWQMLVFAEKRK
jgi:hypothetical protein